MNEQVTNIPPVVPVPEVTARPTSKNTKLIKIVSVLVLFGLLAGVLSALFGNEILEKVKTKSGENSVPTGVGTTSLPTPTTVITERQQILNAFAKIMDSTSVKYSAIGSDGDELSFVREYTVDLEEEREMSTHDEDSIMSIDAYKYKEYVIDGKFYLQTEKGEITQTEARRSPYSLYDISETLDTYLNNEDYRMTSTRTEKEYNGQPAYYIKLDYSKISDTSSIWSRLKVFADVVLEEYTIEAYTTLDGQLLELVIPNVYSQVTYRFLETNAEYDISLPTGSL